MTDAELADEIERTVHIAMKKDQDTCWFLFSCEGALAVIAALRRQPSSDQVLVTDAMVDAVIRRARDGHPPLILDGNAIYNVREMLKAALSAAEAEGRKT